MANLKLKGKRNSLQTIVCTHVERVLKHGIRQFCLAYSGGVDSTVLLAILAELRTILSFDLTALYVHHGLSQNADLWAVHCEQQCTQLNIPFECRRVQVQAQGSGVEAAARQMRYQVFSEQKADCIVMAHHLNDQAETLLLRLLRGCGVQGAGAMKSYVSANPHFAKAILRPLLSVKRNSIVDYALEHHLQWVEDESNQDVRFTRNKIRLAVLPVIEQNFPHCLEVFGRNAQRFSADAQLLKELAQLDNQRLGGHPWYRDELMALSANRLSNLLRWRLSVLGQSMPDAVMLDEFVRQLCRVGQKPFKLILGQCELLAYRNQVVLKMCNSGVNVENLAWHGELELHYLGEKLVFIRQLAKGISPRFMDVNKHIQFRTRLGLSSDFRMRLSMKQPRQSFKKLCQQAGIASWQRSQLPMLEIDGEIVWIAGIGVAAEFQCLPEELGWLPKWGC